MCLKLKNNIYNTNLLGYLCKIQLWLLNLFLPSHLHHSNLNNSQIFLFRSQTTLNKDNAQFPILEIATAIPAS